MIRNMMRECFAHPDPRVRQSAVENYPVAFMHTPDVESASEAQHFLFADLSASAQQQMIDPVMAMMGPSQIRSLHGATMEALTLMDSIEEARVTISESLRRSLRDTDAFLRARAARAYVAQVLGLKESGRSVKLFSALPLCADEDLDVRGSLRSALLSEKTRLQLLLAHRIPEKDDGSFEISREPHMTGGDTYPSQAYDAKKQESAGPQKLHAVWNLLPGKDQAQAEKEIDSNSIDVDVKDGDSNFDEMLKPLSIGTQLMTVIDSITNEFCHPLGPDAAALAREDLEAMVQEEHLRGATMLVMCQLACMVVKHGQATHKNGNISDEHTAFVSGIAQNIYERARLDVSRQTKQTIEAALVGLMHLTRAAPVSVIPLVVENVISAGETIAEGEIRILKGVVSVIEGQPKLLETLLPVDDAKRLVQRFQEIIEGEVIVSRAAKKAALETIGEIGGLAGEENTG